MRITPLPDVDIPIKQEDKNPKDLLTREEVKKVIKEASSTYRAVFTVQSQTGLGITDTLRLDVGDFIKL